MAPRGVPAEFTGMARQLRDAVAAEDGPAGKLMTTLAKRVTTRIRSGNVIPRADTLTGIAHEWRQRMPPRSRLALEIDLDARRKSLRICEMRATASSYRGDGWETVERGLIVLMIQLEAGPHHYTFGSYKLSHISLHAIGRRIQRGLDASEASIMRDFLALGAAHHTLADRADGAEFSVPVQGGSWRGTVQLLRDQAASTDMALAVRTFLRDGG